MAPAALSSSDQTLSNVVTLAAALPASVLAIGAFNMIPSAGHSVSKPLIAQLVLLMLCSVAKRLVQRMLQPCPLIKKIEHRHTSIKKIEPLRNRLKRLSLAAVDQRRKEAEDKVELARGDVAVELAVRFLKEEKLAEWIKKEETLVRYCGLWMTLEEK